VHKKYHVYDAAAGLGGEHHQAIVESTSEEGAIRTYIQYLVEREKWSLDDALLVYSEGELVAVPLPVERTIVDTGSIRCWSTSDIAIFEPYSGMLSPPFAQ
jgi:hypothetical protein